MARGCICIWTERAIKATGWMTNNMVMVQKAGRMVLYTRASTLLVKNKASAFLSGKISQATWGNFITIISMGKGPTCGMMVASTWETGNATKCTAAVFLRGEMAASTQENTATIKNTAMGSFSGPTDATIKVNGRMENKMEKESI